MKDDGGFARAWPAMLASGEADQVLFRLQGLLDEAHIILLLEWPQRQDRTEDGCRFDTHQHRRMDTAGHRRPIGGHDVQLHRVLDRKSTRLNSSHLVISYA